jgi:hypothetical protein
MYAAKINMDAATEMSHTGTRSKWTSNTPCSLKLVQHWVMRSSSADVSLDEQRKRSSHQGMNQWEGRNWRPRMDAVWNYYRNPGTSYCPGYFQPRSTLIKKQSISCGHESAASSGKRIGGRAGRPRDCDYTPSSWVRVQETSERIVPSCGDQEAAPVDA